MSAAVISLLIAGASSTVARRAPRPSGDELIECVRQPGKVRQLTRRQRVGALAIAVDPDRAQAERVCRDNVVEVALSYVDVPLVRNVHLLEELLPVSRRWFVRADL